MIWMSGPNIPKDLNLELDQKYRGAIFVTAFLYTGSSLSKYS